jgi:hypothetical protein
LQQQTEIRGKPAPRLDEEGLESALLCRPKRRLQFSLRQRGGLRGRDRHRKGNCHQCCSAGHRADYRPVTLWLLQRPFGHALRTLPPQAERCMVSVWHD